MNAKDMNLDELANEADQLSLDPYTSWPKDFDTMIEISFRLRSMSKLIEVIADAAKDAISDGVEPAFAAETERRCRRALLNCIEGKEE